MSNSIVVGVGEFAVSNDPDSVIKTFALGSCVAVIFLHRTTRTVGMIHVALPDSKINPVIAKKRPGHFADTGIPAILNEMARQGCIITGKNKGMMVKIAGGSAVMDSNGTFNIGKRNILAVKKVLWSHGMGPMAEDVGGNHGRTVSVPVNSGIITLTCHGRKDWKL